MYKLIALFVLISLFSSDNRALFSAIKKAEIKALNNEQKKIIGNQMELSNRMKDIKTGLNDIGMNNNKISGRLDEIKADIDSVISNTLDLNAQVNGINKSVNKKITGNNNVVNDSELFEKLFYGACTFCTMLVGGFFKLLSNKGRVAEMQRVIDETKASKREWRQRYLELRGAE